MPLIDGITATARIVASGTPSRVLVLTTFDLDSYVYEALKAGEPAGSVLKDMPRDQLIHAVRVVAGGETLLEPAITRRLIGRYAARASESTSSSTPGSSGSATARPRCFGWSHGACRTPRSPMNS